MRPLPFIILALIALALQVGVAPFMAVTSAQSSPQFPLILALFIALFAKPDAALIGCWVLGLMIDLASLGPFGGFAFAFGLAGLGIVHVRASIFRDHPLSHIFLALVFCFLANEIVALREAVSRSAFGNWELLTQLLVTQPLGVAIYTAILAPCLMPLLNSMRRIMRFPEKG